MKLVERIKIDEQMHVGWKIDKLLILGVLFGITKRNFLSKILFRRLMEEEEEEEGREKDKKGGGTK